MTSSFRVIAGLTRNLPSRNEIADQVRNDEAINVICMLFDALNTPLSMTSTHRVIAGLTRNPPSSNEIADQVRNDEALRHLHAV